MASKAHNFNTTLLSGPVSSTILETLFFSQRAELLIPRGILTSDLYSQLALYVLFHCCLKVLLIYYDVI